jgi:hypothetical protein
MGPSLSGGVPPDHGSAIGPAPGGTSAEWSPAPAPAPAALAAPVAVSTAPAVRRGPRPALLVGTGVGVVAAILVLALVVTGVIPLLPRSAGGPETYAEAYSVASHNASEFPGGPWKAIAAIGSAPAVPQNVTVNPSLLGSTGALGSSCVPNLLVANGTVVTVAPYHGNLSSGEASAWLFVFVGSVGQLLLLEVAEGSPTPLATLTCPTLALLTGFIQPLSGSISSGAIAAAAWADGGAGYARTHPGTSEAFGLAGTTAFGVTPTTSNYTVAFENCTALDVAHGVRIDALAVAVDPTTLRAVGTTSAPLTCGAFLSSAIPPGVTGPPPPPTTTSLGTALALGAATLSPGAPSGAYPPCAAGHYCYQVPIERASGVTLADIGMQVNGSAGALWFETAGPGGISIYDPAGHLLAEGGNVVQTGAPFEMFGWIPDSSNGYLIGTNLTSSSVIWLDMGTNDPAGQGFVLEVSGQYPFTGTVPVSLP